MYVHSQAPCRIGIAGGGTDLPVWTRQRVGRCLSLAIKTYVHAVAITRPDGLAVAAYSGHLERAPRATEIGNGLLRESALLHGWKNGFEIHTLSEVPSHGSGLGVSSSIAVALAACFERLVYLRQMNMGEPEGEIIYGPILRERIARNAWTVEIDELDRTIGRQDHMAAAHGGLRLYRFEGDDASVEQLFLEAEAAWVAKHLAVIPLLEGHDAGSILSGVTSFAQLEQADAAVDVALCAVRDRDPAALGHAFSLGQASKLAIPGAAPAWIVDLVGKVNACRGVYGCKVAGAGGGGHLVAACDPEAYEKIRDAIGILPRSVEPDLVGVRSEGWT